VWGGAAHKGGGPMWGPTTSATIPEKNLPRAHQRGGEGAELGPGGKASKGGGQLRDHPPRGDKRKTREKPTLPLFSEKEKQGVRTNGIAQERGAATGNSGTRECRNVKTGRRDRCGAIHDDRKGKNAPTGGWVPTLQVKENNPLSGRRRTRGSGKGKGGKQGTKKPGGALLKKKMQWTREERASVKRKKGQDGQVAGERDETLIQQKKSTPVKEGA